jgi:hypothetical protein
VPQVTTEGWPDDRLTSSDAPSLVRHHAGPADDPDRYELLGEAEGADEAWHVIDHRAATGEALFTLAALRPTGTDGLEVVHTGEDGAPTPPEVLWRERAAGLARVRHARLAGVVSTFAGPAPHAPGQAELQSPQWNYAVLEQAAGRSVADWLRDDPGASIEERFTVLATAASVLQELHRGSEDAPPVVHGDITPRSVRLGGFWPADGVRLAGASLGGLRHGPVQQRSTGVYTAPEVRQGALPSSASDVFGFGATAVLVLTGMPPSTSPDGVVDPALVKRQLAAAALTAQHPGLAELLLQALSTDPAQRPDRLPAWVNGMRAFVEPRSALDPYDGLDLDREPHVAPVSRRTRSLPKRPVVVVVGALLLATAGTAVAIAAVQQGRLKDVPNPVAIVQPPQTAQSLPTSSVPVAPAPAATDSSTSSAGTQAPSTRRPSSAASSATTGDPLPPTGTSLPPGTVPPSLANTTAPTAPPPTVVPPAVVVPPAAEVPTTAVIPPVTGPDVVIPPGSRDPSGPTTTSPTSPVETPTPTDTGTTTPTGTGTTDTPPDPGSTAGDGALVPTGNSSMTIGVQSGP